MASFVPVDATVFASSDDFVRWDVPDAFETVLARIGTGDRLIIAFTRETVTDLMPTAPTVADQTGTVGTAFSITLDAGTGGDGTLTYSVSDEPSWASFNATTRVLSGTPDAAGTTTVTYTVEDEDGDTDSTTFDIVVSAADLMPSLPAISDQTATVGTVFSLTFAAATSGDAPLDYSVSGNPAWLTLSTRTLSGTPDAAGTHTVTVTVTDDDGDTDTAPFTLTVSAVDIAATATINTSAQTIVAGADLVLDATVGGNTPLTILWSATGGTFDDASATDPTWSAPIPDDETDYTLTISVDDDDGDTATATVVITVSDDDKVSLFDSSIINATLGVAWLATTTPWTFQGNAGPVSGTNADARADEIIDSDYIVSGSTAYITLISFVSDGRLSVRTGNSPSVSGEHADPQFTEDAEDNLGFAFRFSNGDEHKARFSILDNSDETEPYTFSAASVTSAGITNNSAFRTALSAGDVQSILVDRSNPGIDWDNLRGDPRIPAAAEITTPAQTIDPDSDITFALTAGGNDPLTYLWEVSPNEGEFSSTTSQNPTWTATSPDTPTTYTFTVTVTNANNDTATDSVDIIVSSLDVQPTLATVPDFTIANGESFAWPLTAAVSGNIPLSYTVTGRPSWMAFRRYNSNLCQAHRRQRARTI